MWLLPVYLNASWESLWIRVTLQSTSLPIMRDSLVYFPLVHQRDLSSRALSIAEPSIPYAFLGFFLRPFRGRDTNSPGLHCPAPFIYASTKWSRISVGAWTRISNANPLVSTGGGPWWGWQWRQTGPSSERGRHLLRGHQVVPSSRISDIDWPAAGSGCWFTNILQLPGFHLEWGPCGASFGSDPTDPAWARNGNLA